MNTKNTNDENDLRYVNRRQKIALFLKKLYDATKKPTTNIKVFEEIATQTGIGSIGSTRSLLVNNMKMLSVTKNRNNEKVVTWTGPEPNLNVADRVTKELAKLFKNYGKVKVEVETQTEPEPVLKEVPKVEAVIEKGDRPDKEFRVHMLMQFLYEKVRDLMLSDSNLDLTSRLKQYSHEPEIIDVLVANKLLDRERSKSEVVFIWVGGEPTNEMAKKITEDLATFLNIERIRSSFAMPVKDKSFNSDEVKVIVVLKESGKQFSEISKIIERSEAEVKKMFYDYIIKINT